MFIFISIFCLYQLPKHIQSLKHKLRGYSRNGKAESDFTDQFINITTFNEVQLFNEDNFSEMFYSNNVPFDTVQWYVFLDDPPEDFAANHSKLAFNTVLLNFNAGSSFSIQPNTKLRSGVLISFNNIIFKSGEEIVRVVQCGLPNLSTQNADDKIPIDAHFVFNTSLTTIQKFYRHSHYLSEEFSYLKPELSFYWDSLTYLNYLNCKNQQSQQEEFSYSFANKSIDLVLFLCPNITTNFTFFLKDTNYSFNLFTNLTLKLLPDDDPICFRISDCNQESPNSFDNVLLHDINLLQTSKYDNDTIFSVSFQEFNDIDQPDNVTNKKIIIHYDNSSLNVIIEDPTKESFVQLNPNLDTFPDISDETGNWIHVDYASEEIDEAHFYLVGVIQTLLIIGSTFLAIILFYMRNRISAKKNTD